MNQDRKGCHSKGRILRQEGHDVPDRCAKHNPPCLMQHAALTIFETFFVQFYVSCLANDIAPPPPPQRPRWHPYSTFEYRLSLKFCRKNHNSAVTLNEEELLILLREQRKPELSCQFCPSIKSFKSIIGLWSHLAHKHYVTGHESRGEVVVDDGRLLDEVRRTAEIRRKHWKTSSDSGKKGNPTMAKLNEIMKEDFSWDAVLARKLT